ncbi:hypothetical protein PG984_014433 [Apiospora sp. TS-2023a]
MRETEITGPSPVEGCSACPFFGDESDKWEYRGSSDDSDNGTEEQVSDTSGESDTTEGSEDDDSDDEEASPHHYLLPEQVEKQLRLLDIDPERSEPFLCSQCRTTDLLAALAHTSKVSQGAANPLVVAERIGLDPDCALCRLFRGTFLSSSEISEDDDDNEESAAVAAHHRAPPSWKLSAFNKRSMLMDIRISWMFQPVEVAILYAGEDAHVQHINEERVEREGFLACARTRDLRALLEKNQSTETAPLSRFVLPQYDPSLVREWLGFCDIDLDGRFGIPGMRVIDCHSYTIVDHLPGMSYFALSYVWGLAGADMVAAETQLIDRADALPLPPMIPRVVSNAIQVVAESGYRYLWVDQFCIDQSAAHEHVAEHISKMDLIYINAALTIIAASSGGALPGVGSTPRTERMMLNMKGRVDEKTGTVEDDLTIFTTPAPVAALQQTVWYSRGWCFQESVLAPRKLYFMDHEMVFQADDINCSDSYPEPHDALVNMFYEFQEAPFLDWSASWNEESGDNSVPFSKEPDPKGIMDQFARKVNHFHKLLEVYTAKQLSQASDSINGFAGVLKVFSRHDPAFQIIQGLPILNVSAVPDTSTDNAKTLMACQKASLLYELCWCHDPSRMKESPERRGHFPSWSWAGWKGQASWLNSGMWLRDNSINESVSSFDFEGIEWEDSSVTDWMDVSSASQPCGNAKYLVGKAPVLNRSEGGDIANWKDGEEHNNTIGGYSVSSVDWYLSVNAQSHEIAHFLESGKWSFLLVSKKPWRDGRLSLLLMVVSWEETDDVKELGNVCCRQGLVSVIVEEARFDVEALPQTKFRLG